MKITNEFIASLRPCEDRHDNYLKHYSKTSFTLKQFFNLSEISTNDKIWVFTKENKEMEKRQRQFALTCADRAVTKVNVPELNGFFTLVCRIVVNDLYELKDTDEFRASYWAAYRATYNAAYRAAGWAAGWAADGAADRAAGCAALYSAYSAANWTTEREMQLDIIKSLV